MKLNYSGNKALVTGGSSSIGLELGKRLIQQEIMPVLTFRNEQGQEKIIKAFDEYKGQFETVFFDFDDPDCIDLLFKNNTDDLEYLVDIAHTDYECLVASASCESTHIYFENNIAVRSRLIRSASRSMLKRNFGRLLFISSAAVERPAEGQGFYASTKLACEALYKNCGIELCSRGVTSLSLRPGYMDTGRGRRFFQTLDQSESVKERKAELRKKSSVIVSVSDLCDSIMFFLSDNARAFNGVAVTMDHGLSSGK